MKIKKLLAGFLVIFLLGLVWFFFKPGMRELNAPTRTEPDVVERTEESPVVVTPLASPDTESSFSETGNLVFDDGSWFLLYEEPGAPALRLELLFSEDTNCDLGENQKDCDLTRVKSGARITVFGMRKDDKLYVTELQLQND